MKFLNRKNILMTLLTIYGLACIVEAIAANHMGLKICGISCVCNLAAGISPTPLTHEEVQQAGRDAAGKFEKLVTLAVKRMADI